MTRDEKLHLLQNQSTLDFLIIQATIILDPRLRQRWDPNDLAQETLAQAFQRLEQICAESKAQFFAFLKGTLRHLHLHMLRAACAGIRNLEQEQSMQIMQESCSRLEAILQADISSPSEQVMRTELDHRVSEFLAHLSEQDRLILIDHYFHGRSCSLIAKDLGITQYKVSLSIQRTLGMLRPLLKDYEGML